MQHYELLYIIPTKFSEGEIGPIIDKINQLITDRGGKVTIEDDLGKKKLAYPIKDQHHGYYILNEFDLEPKELEAFNRQLKLTEEILRHQVVKKKAKTLEDLKKEKELKEKITQKHEKKVSEQKETTTKPEQRVSMEDLDKKIDEILDTDII